MWNNFYDCNLFFLERALYRTYIYFFILTTNIIVIIRPRPIYLHFVHYTFIMTFPLKEAHDLIYAESIKSKFAV